MKLRHTQGGEGDAHPPRHKSDRRPPVRRRERGTTIRARSLALRALRPMQKRTRRIHASPWGPCTETDAEAPLSAELRLRRRLRKEPLELRPRGQPPANPDRTHGHQIAGQPPAAGHRMAAPGRGRAGALETAPPEPTRAPSVAATPRERGAGPRHPWQSSSPTLTPLSTLPSPSPSSSIPPPTQLSPSSCHRRHARLDRHLIIASARRPPSPSSSTSPSTSLSPVVMSSSPAPQNRAHTPEAQPRLSAGSGG